MKIKVNNSKRSRLVFHFVLMLFLLSLNSFDPGERIDEKIRQKVENLPVFKALNKEYEIYCIPSIREVYLNNDFDPFWTDEGMIDEFIHVISKAHEQGLQPDDYHYSDILEIRQIKTDEYKANLDIVLTDAFLLYASHILSGKTNPVSIDPEWHVLKTDKNPIKYLYELNPGNVKQLIKSLEPAGKNYTALKKKLALYREMENKIKWDRIPGGDFIKPGMSDPRIPEISKRLEILGDLPIGNNIQTEVYDENLKEAVILFQQRHGLDAQGNIGPQTIDMLNVSPTERVKKILVNLERLRWLPQEIPNYYLWVNIVNFDLDVIIDNQIVRNHKVIVGKEYRKTPVFSSTMQYLVFNPTWTVPPTILKNDMIPEVRKSTSYLAQKNIYVYNNQGVKMNPDSIDWKSNKVLSYTYRQEPGPLNALGTVKFMFPNKFNVYLHDTPGRELFNRTERAFSSGCIRVQNPLELAEFLLRDQPQYNIQEIKKIIKTNIPTTVKLKEKPEVYLIYLTTWVNEKNIIHFRKDIYERDENVYIALGAKPEYDIE